MNRVAVMVCLLAGFVAAACASAAGTASTSPSPGRGTQFRNGAAGRLVQVNGQTLILTGPNGDLTVTFATTTAFTRTSIAVLADIVPGQCIVATGQKDSAGLLTATTVRLSPKTSSGCTAAGRFGPNPFAGASPRPTPSGQPAQAPFVSGEVTSAVGISITVMTASSGSQTITVPTVATVIRALLAASTDLRTGECLRAIGPLDASGAVQATSIAITPPGPSGTCATGFGGSGRGFGRGGAGPGAGAPSN